MRKKFVHTFKSAIMSLPPPPDLGGSGVAAGFFEDDLSGDASPSAGIFFSFPLPPAAGGQGSKTTS